MCHAKRDKLNIEPFYGKHTAAPRLLPRASCFRTIRLTFDQDVIEVPTCCWRSSMVTRSLEIRMNIDLNLVDTK